jgi:hypothetical protein
MIPNLSLLNLDIFSQTSHVVKRLSTTQHMGALIISLHATCIAS